MKQWTKYFAVAVVACALGATAMRWYDQRQFERIAYGPQLRYGVVDPIHAVNHLVTNGDGHKQQAAAIYLIQHHNYATADALTRAHPQAAPTARPYIEVGLGNFCLSNYRSAPDASVRISALHASRYWRSDGKAALVAAFLSDSDPNVVGQAVYELGEIGDPSVLSQLQAGEFDNTSFIGDVRKRLAEKATQQRRTGDGV